MFLYLLIRLMMKETIHKLYIFIIFFLITTTTFSQNNISFAKKGVLDLTEWTFEKDGIVNISGEWEFYWSEFYTSEDFDSNLIPDAYLNVPNSWNTIKINHKNPPDTGFATLRLIVKTDTIFSNLAISFKEVITAYDVWVNGKYVTGLGTVAKNSNQDKPVIRINKKTISLNKGENEIIVHISNFENTRSAFVKPPNIGTDTQIYMNILRSVSLDLIIFGFLFVMSFYHFGLYIFRKKLVSALVFSIFLLVVSIRILVTSNFMLSYFIPNLSLQTIYKLSYFTYYSGVPLMLLYIQKTFKENKFKLLFNLSYFISSLFLLSLFFPSLIYIKLSVIYQAISLFIIVFALFLLIKYSLNRKEGAFVLLLSSLILSFAVINDILFMNDILQTGILTPYGLFVLILGQSLTSISIFSSNDKQNIELSKRLKFQNQNLQKIVRERTKDIQLQTDTLEYQNTQLKELNKKLKIYFTAIEQSPLPIILTDKNLNIEFVNPVFHKFLIGSNKILGKNVKTLNFGNNIENNYNENWQKLVESGSWKGEFILNKSKNIENKYEVIISPIHDHRNIVTNYLAIVKDVTALKLKEEALVKQNNRLVNLFGKLEIMYEEIIASINYAKRLQSALLPNRQRLLETFDDYLLVYKPKERVSGDFYYVNKCNNNKIFAVGDCSGSGVHGAFMTMIAISKIHQIIQREEFSTPAEILENLRKDIKILFRNFGEMPDEGFDLGIGIINQERNILTFAGANINMFSLKNNEKVELHKAVKNPIGFHPYEKPFTDIEIILEKDDKYFMITDGLINQKINESRILGKKGIIDLLTENKNLTFTEHKEKAVEVITSIIEKYSQIDDITVFGIKI